MHADDLPYLSSEYRIRFPDPDPDDEYGIVMVGGNLSPGILLSAYEQGAFPWYSAYQPILWWNPPRRCVMFPENYHVSRSMKKFLRKTDLQVTKNKACEQVIRSCKEIERPGQQGTWITEDVLEFFLRMHEIGYVHSYEVWDSEQQLVGGLYGLQMSHYFCGESMFAKVSNASKLAFHHLYQDVIISSGFSFIDFQVTNEHSERLGAIEIDRDDFLKLL